MREKQSVITQAGYQRLQAQLTALRTVQRPAALQNLQDVRDGGDWRDSAQLIQMQNALGLIDAEIQRLEELLEDSEIAEAGKADAVVDIGETVILQNEVADDGAVERYTIVSPAESNPDLGCISYESPLGRALLKQKVGAKVAINVPAGRLQYRILAVQ